MNGEDAALFRYSDRLVRSIIGILGEEKQPD